MTFQESLKILNIEDYAERIINSNSHGELSHIQIYPYIAEILKRISNTNPSWFREWFKTVVEYAEKNWERPESVFQHIDTILIWAIKK